MINIAKFFVFALNLLGSTVPKETYINESRDIHSEVSDSLASCVVQPKGDPGKFGKFESWSVTCGCVIRPYFAKVSHMLDLMHLQSLTRDPLFNTNVVDGPKCILPYVHTGGNQSA